MNFSILKRNPSCETICDSNQTIKDGKCAQKDLCEAGKVWDGTTCVKICSEDQVLTENNTCEYQHQVANYKGYHVVDNNAPFEPPFELQDIIPGAKKKSYFKQGGKHRQRKRKALL